MHGQSVVLTLHIDSCTIGHQGDVRPDHVQREVLGYQNSTILCLPVVSYYNYNYEEILTKLTMYLSSYFQWCMGRSLSI